MIRLRIRHLAAAGVITALALAPTAQAAASVPAAAPKPKEETKVLDWLATLESTTRPDRVRQGDDWSVYTHLYEHTDGKRGKKIGDGTAHCVAVLVTREGAVVQCERVLRTDAGHLSLSDTMDRFGRGPHTAPSAVTGGTGDYADAEGEARIVLHDRHATFRITLDD
ncbi:hypothetical protein [Streptomyces sp. NPDC047928]|uniref:hypothetical protein n=1 Tax=unclassified Streptomyces TaxID=2593676 RepID=UPI00371441B9